MKKLQFIFLITTFSLSFVVGFSQNNNGPKKHGMDEEKIKAEKVAYITEKVDLTVKEAQVFWPLYNEFNDKISELFQEERQLYRTTKKNHEALSDEELTINVDRMVAINKEKAILEAEYHKKYKEVLPIKKVSLLYQADKEFRKHLLHKYKGPIEE